MGESTMPEKYLIIVYDREGYDTYQLSGYSLKDAIMRHVRLGGWMFHHGTDFILEDVEEEGYFEDDQLSIKEFKEKWGAVDNTKDATMFEYCQDAMDYIMFGIWENMLENASVHAIFFKITEDTIEDITTQVMDNTYQGGVPYKKGA